MIVVRDVFRMKFGQARAVKELMKEFRKLMPAEANARTRVLFDLTGPSYTMVLEMTFASASAWEQEMASSMNEAEWRSWYQRFIPLMESSFRELLTIMD